MKLIEVSLDTDINVIMIRWDTGDGELFIELTPSSENIGIYCDGEGTTEFNVLQNTINAGVIIPKLSVS